MSIFKMIDTFFGGETAVLDGGHFNGETPLTPKQRLETAFQRHDDSIAKAKRSQAKLKQSLKEWSDSSADLSACISECEDDCDKCVPCQSSHKAYYEHLRDALKDLP